jgi:hypothetical protein
VAVTGWKSVILGGKCRPRTYTLSSERRSGGARQIGEALEGFPVSKAGGPFFLSQSGKNRPTFNKIKDLVLQICYIFDVYN